MTFAVLLSFLAVPLTFGVHFQTILLSSTHVSKLAVSKNMKIFISLLILYMAHLFEVLIYAIVYMIAVETLDIGTFAGMEVNSFLDYFYYSIVTYTSLGIGDVYPQGHLRFITGTEALNGLLLITWSASYMFLTLSRFLKEAECCDKEKTK